jgi:hypothetical protein
MTLCRSKHVANALAQETNVIMLVSILFVDIIVV